MMLSNIIEKQNLTTLILQWLGVIVKGIAEAI